MAGPLTVCPYFWSKELSQIPAHFRDFYPVFPIHNASHTAVRPLSPAVSGFPAVLSFVFPVFVVSAMTLSVMSPVVLLLSVASVDILPALLVAVDAFPENLSLGTVLPASVLLLFRLAASALFVFLFAASALLAFLLPVNVSPVKFFLPVSLLLLIL